MQPAGALNPTDWQPRKLAVIVVSASAAREPKIVDSSSWALVEVNMQTIVEPSAPSTSSLLSDTEQQEQIPNDMEMWQAFEKLLSLAIRYNYETLQVAQNSA